MSSRNLETHQRTAIDAYFRLMDERPELFTDGKHRRLIRDRGAIERYVAQHGRDLGVVADTPYVKLVVDLVQSTTGNSDPYSYQRFIDVNQLKGGINVVVVPVVAHEAVGEPGRIILVGQERHATRKCHLELPRGFGAGELTAEANALKELREETGFIGNEPILLGTTYINTGMTDAEASYVYVPVTGRAQDAPEAEESIEQIALLTRDDVWRMISNGELRDSFTIQGIALLEKHSACPWNSQ